MQKIVFRIFIAIFIASLFGFVVLAYLNIWDFIENEMSNKIGLSLLTSLCVSACCFPFTDPSYTPWKKQ